MKISLGDTDFIAAGKALIWPSKNAVVVADVHLGKSSYFQTHGMLIPEQTLRHDLDRILDHMSQYDAERLIVLGDLFHHERGLTSEFLETFAWWRHRYPFELVLIEGNHDRRITYPEEWGLVVEPEMDWEGLSFRHEWDDKAIKPQLVGHLHPALSIGRGADRVRVPCFWVRPQGIVLPAFTDLSGHYHVKLAPDESAVLVTPQGHIQIP